MNKNKKRVLFQLKVILNKRVLFLRLLYESSGIIRFNPNKLSARDFIEKLQKPESFNRIVETL